MLEIKHFDSHTGKWIQDPLKKDEIFTEKLDNTLLELYFPNGKFSFAKIDEATTEAELRNNQPEGQVLLLSSKTRMLFGEKEYRDRLDKILPDLKDRGAYGSIFLGSCTNAINKKINLLVVDDANGKNGDLLPDDFAFQLTGDCHGKVSNELYREVFGKEYHIIQHRLGIPELDRFGKGTIAAAKFENYPWKGEKKADLIIPTSSFKGGKLSPGLYEVDIWLGEKERSQLGKAAITPLYGSYPELLKDTLPTLDNTAYELRQKLNNLPALAELYCQRYEEQAKDYKEKQVENEEEEIVDRLDRSTYILMRAAVDSKDPTLLEMPLLTEELTKFVTKEWKNNAIGKDPKIAWDRAMIIPSKQLKEGEICVSWENEDKTILNTRYPYLNSNAMGVSQNKHLEEMYAPDGSAYKGVILVPDESHDRIHQRLDETIAAECQRLGLDADNIRQEALNRIEESIDPIEFNRNRINQTIDLINQKGGNITETAPVETIMERQAYDFDGDNNVITNAENYPNLHQAAIGVSRKSLFR
jgi:hypothetical protein